MVPFTFASVFAELPDGEALRQWLEMDNDRPAAQELLVLSALYASRVEISCRHIRRLATECFTETSES